MITSYIGDTSMGLFVMFTSSALSGEGYHFYLGDIPQLYRDPSF